MGFWFQRGSWGDHGNWEPAAWGGPQAGTLPVVWGKANTAEAASIFSRMPGTKRSPGLVISLHFGILVVW